MYIKTLYTKQFPKDPALEQLKKQAHADKFNSFQARFSNLAEMLEYVDQNTVYTPLPHKVRNQKNFIQAAIELSEAYEIDVEISQHKGAVCADFSLPNGAFFRKVNRLMAMGDEFGFYARDDGNIIVFSVTYFTHRQERNGFLIAP